MAKIQLGETQHRVLIAVRDGPGAVEDIARAADLDQAEVVGTARFGEERGWIRIHEQQVTEIALADNAAAWVRDGLPERRFLNAMSGRRELPLRDAAALATNLGSALNEVLKWGGARGWLEKREGSVFVTEKGEVESAAPTDDERALTWILANGAASLETLDSQGIDSKAVVANLGHRGNVARVRSRTRRHVELTDVGRAFLASGDYDLRRQQNQLSPDDIATGRWRLIDLRPYDVSLDSDRVVPVKPHPFRRILERARHAFLEMGFEEAVSPMVDSSFWVFDALFQPQDHPARDMQDTFYVARPATGELPDDSLVERVRATHENGWTTGSVGWGYNWSRDRARRMVLRTHTTATTIRALAQNPEPPRKVFAVGRVFRNEAISYKHLPEFNQVDGIVIDKEANLTTLLGMLQEFYRKMGFEKVKFKPSFFPYTEPSAEVFVFMPARQTWIEMGGAGIFRPEVTRPFGCTCPVLAWGLGLERLAMKIYELDDIRRLYWTDLDWLEEVPLCQS